MLVQISCRIGPMKKKSAVSSQNRRRASLAVFVSAHCWQCPEARSIAEDMGDEFDSLDVRVIDLDSPHAQKPASVFAVPTFLLNDQVVSIGTPSRDALRYRIESALNARGAQDESR